MIRDDGRRSWSKCDKGQARRTEVEGCEEEKVSVIRERRVRRKEKGEKESKGKVEEEER